MVTQDAGQMWLLERGPKVDTSVCSPLGLPMLLWQQDMGTWGLGRNLALPRCWLTTRCVRLAG